MFNFTATTQGLDQSLHSPHSHATQRSVPFGGGVETSRHTGRSRYLGRVAVTHVQGSPKGGGALSVCRVSNTRLCPVPPYDREARLSWGQQNSSIDDRLQVIARTGQTSRYGGRP